MWKRTPNNNKYESLNAIKSATQTNLDKATIDVSLPLRPPFDVRTVFEVCCWCVLYCACVLYVYFSDIFVKIRGCVLYNEAFYSPKSTVVLSALS